VPAAQRAIDSGAVDAGRDPSTIRRIYNVIGTIDGDDGVGLRGSAAEWASTLAEWHHDLGFDTFVSWPTNHADDQLERFARDVVPRVRELGSAVVPGAAGPTASRSTVPSTTASPSTSSGPA
jgi:hypothetical protein